MSRQSSALPALRPAGRQEGLQQPPRGVPATLSAAPRKAEELLAPNLVMSSSFRFDREAILKLLVI